MMTENWTIEDCVSEYVGQTPCWRVIMTRTDGQPHHHIMPMTTLEWRAAEYGIDPTDVDTLMEMILHEPHIPMVDDVSGPRFADKGPTLMTADSTPHARQTHQSRLATAAVKIDVRGAKPLDLIRQVHKPDGGVVQAMRENVDIRRWVTKYGDLPVAQPLAQDPTDLKVSLLDTSQE